MKREILSLSLSFSHFSWNWLCGVCCDEADEADEDGFQWNNVYVVIEGLENCYLNRNSKGQIFFDKSFRESLFLREHINKKSKSMKSNKIKEK